MTAGRRERAAGGDADWYKDAVVYALDVRTFADGDGDGIGDFPGLTARLDYLAALGVTCLWLLPCYPTPNRDNGYDVADYDAIDSRLGTLDDFRAFRRAAAERGMKLILDLVVHHTSDQHPWLRAARADPSSPYRPAFGRGAWRVLEAGARCALALRFAWQGHTVVAIHNLADRPCAVDLDPDGAGGGPLVDLFADRAYAPVGGGRAAVELDGYGYRWLGSPAG